MSEPSPNLLPQGPGAQQCSPMLHFGLLFWSFMSASASTGKGEHCLLKPSNFLISTKVVVCVAMTRKTTSKCHWLFCFFCQKWGDVSVGGLWSSRVTCRVPGSVDKSVPGTWVSLFEANLGLSIVSCPTQPSLDLAANSHCCFIVLFFPDLSITWRTRRDSWEESSWESLHVFRCCTAWEEAYQQLGFSALVWMGLQMPCVSIRNGITLIVQSSAPVLLHHWRAVLRSDAP